jgi:hypothetical protein
MEQKSDFPIPHEFQKIPHCGIMPPIVTENNRVKCVFLDEKGSIFALGLV